MPSLKRVTIDQIIMRNQEIAHVIKALSVNHTDTLLRDVELLIIMREMELSFTDLVQACFCTGIKQTTVRVSEVKEWEGGMVKQVISSYNLIVENPVSLEGDKITEVRMYEPVSGARLIIGKC